MTPPRIRQLVIAANSLDTAEKLQDILGLGKPYPDPGVGEFGLKNAVFALGDQFLEVIVPVTPDAPARRFIDRFGEGGYMAIFQTPDIEGVRARGDDMKLRRVWNYNSDEIAASHFHPADVGGAIVSVDEPRPPESWRWGGPDWQKNAVPGAITGMLAQSPKPDDMGLKWATILGTAYLEIRRIETRDGHVNFRQSETPGIPEFHVRVEDKIAALERARALGVSVSETGFDLAGVTFRVS